MFGKWTKPVDEGSEERQTRKEGRFRAPCFEYGEVIQEKLIEVEWTQQELQKEVAVLYYKRNLIYGI